MQDGGSERGDLFHSGGRRIGSSRRESPPTNCLITGIMSPADTRSRARRYFSRPPAASRRGPPGRGSPGSGLRDRRGAAGLRAGDLAQHRIAGPCEATLCEVGRALGRLGERGDPTRARPARARVSPAARSVQRDPQPHAIRQLPLSSSTTPPTTIGRMAVCFGSFGKDWMDRSGASPLQDDDSLGRKPSRHGLPRRLA